MLFNKETIHLSFSHKGNKLLSQRKSFYFSQANSPFLETPETEGGYEKLGQQVVLSVRRQQCGAEGSANQSSAFCCR